MARKRGKKNSDGSGILALFIMGAIVSAFGNMAIFLVVGVMIAIAAIIIIITNNGTGNTEQRKQLEDQRLKEQQFNEWLKEQNMIEEQRKELLNEILCELHLENIDSLSLDEKKSSTTLIYTM